MLAIIPLCDDLSMIIENGLKESAGLRKRLGGRVIRSSIRVDRVLLAEAGGALPEPGSCCSPISGTNPKVREEKRRSTLDRFGFDSVLTRAQSLSCGLGNSLDIRFY